jgi:hypothetical protein
MAKASKNTDIIQSREKLHKFDARYDAAKVLINAIKWIAIAYFVADSIKTLAGKVTLASINFKAIISQEAAGVSIGWILAIVGSSLIVAVLGILYGRYESKLRKDTIERLTSQITFYQKLIDSGRTSSMLTTRGETSERDRR